MVKSIAELARLDCVLGPCLVVPLTLAPPVTVLALQELQLQPRLRQLSMLQLHHLLLPLLPARPLCAPKLDTLLIEDNASRQAWIVLQRVTLLSVARWLPGLPVVQAVHSL